MSIFSKVPKGKQVRNKFDLSYSSKFTMKTGLLYPIYAEEVVPGDIFGVGSGIVIRSQPTIAPVYSNYYAEVRYFYVPNRLVWEGFKEFMMDQVEGSAQLQKPMESHPSIAWTGSFNQANGSIYDFFNVPMGCRMPVNALPFRMYNLIWNEYFRDQNLQDAKKISTNYKDDAGDYELLRVNWTKDYFSSALPWTQRGSVVNMPADVMLRDYRDYDAAEWPYQKVVRQDGTNGWHPANWASSASNNNAGVLKSLSNPNVASYGGLENDGGNLAYTSVWNGSASGSQQLAAYLDPNGTMGVDINIRDLRFATAVQRFLEREALVGGGRYADWIRGIYGVNIGDATLQRPLYLGGGRNGINISPVEQTSMTASPGGGIISPQGTLAGKGYMSSLFRCNKMTLFAEHGWVIGLMYIRPEALYARGLNRHMMKDNRFDYVIPGFEHLGEDVIKNYEVYCLSQYTGSSTDAQATIDNLGDFGYQSRQAIYKSHNGEVHGEIKENMSKYAVMRFNTTVNDTPIPLNSDFVECNPDEENIFAISPDTADSWIVDGRNIATVYRNLKKYPRYGL